VTNSDGQETLNTVPTDSLHSKVGYQHLIENIQDAVVEFELVDSEPIVRDVNPAFEQTFGYDADDVCGDSLNDWIVPDHLAEQASELDSQTETGEIISQQLTRKTATGMREFLHRSIPYDGPETVDGIAVYTDITERVRAEQKRQLMTDTSRCIGEAETLQQGFETTLQSICSYTEWSYGEVWQPSHEGEELTFVVGYTEDPDCEPFHEASKSVTFRPGHGLPGRVYDSGSSEWIADVSQEPAKVFHRTDIAAEMNIHAAFGAPVMADGDVVAVLVFFLRDPRDHDEVLITDVTDVANSLGGLVERKQVEETVRRRNEQLERFANVISHDLRNPLNVAAGHLDMLPGNEHTAMVASAHGRMRELIDDILTLARQGRSIEDPQQISLADCAAESWSMIQAESATITINTTFTVEGDESRLQQLFENLLRNAIDHGPPDVTITIGDMKNGFYVADDGPGIPEEERSEVFDLGHTTRSDGTGFGLPIILEIAESHGWSVSVTDSDSGGARFEFVGVNTDC